MEAYIKIEGCILKYRVPLFCPQLGKWCATYVPQENELLELELLSLLIFWWFRTSALVLVSKNQTGTRPNFWDGSGTGTSSEVKLIIVWN
jgi:hypothetical protein